MPTHSDKTDVTTSPSVLNSGASIPLASLLLEADSANTDDILWGDVNLQNMTLIPGQLQPIPADYMEEVFVKSVAGTQVLHIAYVTA